MVGNLANIQFKRDAHSFFVGVVTGQLVFWWIVIWYSGICLVCYITPCRFEVMEKKLVTKHTVSTNGIPQVTDSFLTRKSENETCSAPSFGSSSLFYDEDHQILDMNKPTSIFQLPNSKLKLYLQQKIKDIYIYINTSRVHMERKHCELLVSNYVF